MQNDLSQIIKSFNIAIENYDLNELSDYLKLHGDSCFFLFDLQSDKCFYLSPSIINILGYNHKNYLNKGFLFLRSIIHPDDFSYLITEIISLIKLAKNPNQVVNSGNKISSSVRFKHKDSSWIKLKIHLIFLKRSCSNRMNLLLGFIEKDIVLYDENTINLFNVSTREKEVLKYLAEGHSAKTIAYKLFISEYTVISHRKNLIQKLKVKNSAELIKKGFELNILN
jgi:DNA-binding CsgD family transcriptional regulator